MRWRECSKPPIILAKGAPSPYPVNVSMFRLFSRRNELSDRNAAVADAVGLIRDGNEREDRGEFESARQLYQQAVELAPDLAAAHLNLGNAFGMLGRLDDALSQYRRAVELDPGYLSAHLNLGATLLHIRVCKRRGGKLS